MKAGSGADDSAVRQFIVGQDDEGARLDRWFKRHLPQVGFAMISRWARTGQIRVDGKRADPADRLSAGQVLRVPPGGATPTTAAAPRRAKPRPEVSEEDRSLAQDMLIAQTPAALILNKPPGLATQGGSGTHRHVDGLLDAYVEDGGPRPRLVHRLDKDTSGVLLVARTPGSAAFFSRNFADRSARKIYWALIAGVPSIDDGLIDLPLAKQPGSGGEKMMVDHVQGAPSRTRYRVIDRAGNSAAWVELQPLTGRTHQLRVHMAAIGHPIIGDGKYGGPEAFLTGTISRKMHLHARRLVVAAPGGTTIDVTAPLPGHIAASLSQLGFTESDGDLVQIEAPAPPRREVEKKAAKAHAKDMRKERRGERRRRADDPAPTGKAAKLTGKAAAKPGAKPGAKPATRRAPARGAPKNAGPKGRGA